MSVMPLIWEPIESFLVRGGRCWEELLEKADVNDQREVEEA